MNRTVLPIDEILPELIDRLRSHKRLVLKADPGAGKTTRVPPAMLDAGLAELAHGKPGQIVVLQPRRIAARSAAARISEERGTAIGQEIGYQVRNESRASKNTRILICTEGVFIRRLQDDPLLDGIAAVLFDEFHERSIDGDLALALVRQVAEQIRTDLRIMVMSATLDPEPIVHYLGGCPSVVSPGRNYPVQIEYLQHHPNEQIERTMTDAILRILPQHKGHVLAFLPGVGEIRRVQESLSASASGEQGNLILPLYGDLPLEEQQSVIRPSDKRKIILATNVAETSVTISGVTTVIDSGLARTNRFHPQLGLNRLQVGRISRASADQRAGRAGRTAPGFCLRLWRERDQLALRDFEEPEIARVELSQSILQLMAWGETDVRTFPWFEAPPAASIDRALQLLDLLDAIKDGNLTDLGRSMAALPIQPRLARLILEGGRLGHAPRAALCAALLSERDPFRRNVEKRIAQHSSDSDVIDRLIALENFSDHNERHSDLGVLQAGPAKQILQTSTQLARLYKDNANQATKEDGSSKQRIGADEAILRSLVAAFPDRVCKRRRSKDKRALMVGGRGVVLDDESAVHAGELFVAVELADSGRSDTLVRQASFVDKSWLPATHLNNTVDVVYDPARKKVMAFKRGRFQDLLIDESAAELPADADTATILAAGIIANKIDLSTLLDEAAVRYLARIECLREWIPELNLPALGADSLEELLPSWCIGCTSVDDLTAEKLVAAVKAQLTLEQTMAIDSEAPEVIRLAGGRRGKVQYEPGKPPIVAARIQEFFGSSNVPPIAKGRVPVLLHLLAPNNRVQQITPDLAGFWTNTYPRVKNELKKRYPKHAWPDDPLRPNAKPS